jgi:hypothetical protein
LTCKIRITGDGDSQYPKGEGNAALALITLNSLKAVPREKTFFANAILTKHS